MTPQDRLISQAEKDSIINSMQAYVDDKPEYIITTLNRLLALTDNDSVTMARIHSKLGSAYRSKSDYANSFDHFFSALKFLETTKSSLIHAQTANNLGALYANFDLDKEALDYYYMSKGHYENNLPEDRNNNYIYILLNIATAKSFQKRYDEALKYIDTAYSKLESDTITSVTSKKIALAIVGIEKANTLFMLKKLDSSRILAEKNSKILEELHIDYALFWSYYYLGKIYNEEENYKKALLFARKADSLEQRLDDQEAKRDVSFLYAEVYEKLKDPSNSYKYLKQGKEIDDALFSAKETAAFYRLRRDVEMKEEERKLIVLQKDKVINETYYLLYGISALAVFGIVLLISINQRNKYKKEKEITRLELERTASTLGFKKKELTTAALQIIENGEKVKHFQKSIALLKEDLDSKYHPRLNSLSASISNNTDKNWSAFKQSFEQVNTTFFENLKKTYPDLTPNDLKLCSFLKLNFNSKDIANFMGISHESVRISRYRLRKKMNLTRNENLTKHISAF